MSSGVRLHPTEDRDFWGRFVADHPGSTAFSDWEWLDFQADLLGVRIERFVIAAGGRPVGVFAAPRRSARSLVSGVLPFPFVGPLVAPELLSATIAAFRHWQLKSGLLVARFDLGPADVGSDTADLLRAAHLEVREDATVIVDMAHGSVQKLREAYTKSRRAKVRRAAREGVTVRLARPGEFAELVPHLLHETYGAREQPSPYPADVGTRFEQWAAGREWVTTWVVTVGDELAGTQVMLGRHPTAIAWVGGCLRRFRASAPDVLLCDGMLEGAVERGHTAVDFSGWVDDGIGSYKLAFGGQRYDYLGVQSFVPTIARSGMRRAIALIRR